MNSEVFPVYLGLGSNLGDRVLSIKTAIEHLRQTRHSEIGNVSPMYTSKPWGNVTSQPDFVNAVVLFKTQLKPLELLERIKYIEYQLMGRISGKRWDQRIIDIDILFYGDLSHHDEQLCIPHQYVYQRCFVLQPLADLNTSINPEIDAKIKSALSRLKCSSQLQLHTP